ncbi:hypothetical protein BH10PSE12_BH10PSE12_37420 [soil metagenome]
MQEEFASNIDRKSAATIFAVALLAMLPSFLFGPGATHSAPYNFMWIGQFGDAMANGNLYPRWFSASFEGLGAPTFYFYPPLAYWVGGAAHALGVSVLQAINVSGLVLLFASGLTMYLWLAARGTRPLLGAILYMVFPYHLIDFYIRGALAEFAAFIWIPLIALAIERLPQRRGIVLLAVSLGGLAISHLPMAMLAGLFLMAPLIGQRAWKDRAVILPAVCGIGIGFALAGFYLVPALTLQSHISTVMLWSGGYLPSHWSVRAAKWSMLPAISAAMALLSLPSRSLWTGIAVVGSVAALNLMPFLWDVPPLYKAQFPWRLLCLVEFSAVTALVSCRPRIVPLYLGIALLVPPYIHGALVAWGDIVRPVDYANIARTMPEAPEYLPVGADLSGMTDDHHIARLDSYRGFVRDTDITVSHPGPVSLHHAAFPIWQVTQDGRPIASTGPMITFYARPGHHYRVERVIIWQEVVGPILSLLAALLLALVHRFGVPDLRLRALRTDTLIAAARRTA